MIDKWFEGIYNGKCNKLIINSTSIYFIVDDFKQKMASLGKPMFEVGATNVDRCKIVSLLHLAVPFLT